MVCRMADTTAIVAPEHIDRTIAVVRGQRVMLDADLAALYGVKTGNLVLAVKRNLERFPEDFMFQLTKEEFEDLRLQFASSSSRGGRRYLPYAFTEQGVAMLSSVLRSPRAVQVNVEIMRAFVRLRVLLTTNAEISQRLGDLERRVSLIFAAVADLMPPNTPPERKPLGFPAPQQDSGPALPPPATTSLSRPRH